MNKLRVLDLFSGIGGFSLGLERAGMQTVAFCEIEPFCRKVLAKHWPGVPIYDDVRELTAARLAADGIGADVICGGFPCQDISISGRGAGLAGERSGLWREYTRIIGEVRPRFVIVENVAALLHRGLGDVLGDLAALGYDSEWHCIPAAAVGLPHTRDRVWVIADNHQFRMERDREITFSRFLDVSWVKNVGRAKEISRRPGIFGPALCGTGHGVPRFMDRLRSLGNAVVPQIPELIGRAILKAEAQVAIDRP